MDGDWRMSSSIFTEAMIPRRPRTFRITYSGHDTGHGTTVDAEDIDQIINELTSDHQYEAKVHKTQNEATISFSKWGIKKGGTVTIRRV